LRVGCGTAWLHPCRQELGYSRSSSMMGPAWWRTCCASSHLDEMRWKVGVGGSLSHHLRRLGHDPSSSYSFVFTAPQAHRVPGRHRVCDGSWGIADYGCSHSRASSQSTIGLRAQYRRGRGTAQPRWQESRVRDRTRWIVRGGSCGRTRRCTPRLPHQRCPSAAPFGSSR